jgi:hypothetical protein
MDRHSVPACPKCTSVRVFQVTKGGVKMWHCNCDHTWSVSEADKGQKNPST